MTEIVLKHIDIEKPKNGISIFVTAYNTVEYIDDCIESIRNQSYIKNGGTYELLLGIDGCNKMYDYVNDNPDKFNDLNIRVLYMDKNVGTYVTSNTLINESKYDYLMRFDSDDVMHENMIESIMLNFDGYDVVRYKYSVLGGLDVNIFSAGSIAYTRKFINKYGGYQPWICAADSELIERGYYELINSVNMCLYSRRIRSDSLTKDKETNMKSQTRKDYRKKIDKVKDDYLIEIDRYISNFKEIKI